MHEPLKILFLNSSDTHGGAARAAYRLFEGLREQGVSVKMLVRDKESNDTDVISCLDFERNGLVGKLDKFVWKIKNRIRKQKWKKYPDRERIFLNDLNSIPLFSAIQSIDFDVLHLHFVANCFLDLRELTKINKPIVWTLHDSWPFTGICHFSYDCYRYEKSCGSCPMLHSDNPNDFTHKIWKTKNKVYGQCNMHIVTPSRWLGASATKSSLFSNLPVTVIPNGINTHLYRPIPVVNAKRNLGLEEDKYYILFGAVNATTDDNKGFHLLKDALQYLLKGRVLAIELLIFGADKPIEPIDFGFPVHYLGVIKAEETLVKFYSTAHVMVVPSMSENLSNAIMESLACGTPVVGFEIGGNSDMIDHKQNGYLAKAFDTEDLAKGINWCLENNTNDELSDNARNKVLKNFTKEKVSKQYVELYKTILK